VVRLKFLRQPEHLFREGEPIFRGLFMREADCDIPRSPLVGMGPSPFPLGERDGSGNPSGNFGSKDPRLVSI
jgi:hypothetical protein